MDGATPAVVATVEVAGTCGRLSSVVAGDLSRSLLDTGAAVGVVDRGGVAGLVEAADLVVGEVEAGGAQVVVQLCLGCGRRG